MVLTELLATASNIADIAGSTGINLSSTNFLLTVIAALVGGGSISAIIVGLISRKKTKAETRVLEVTGDVKIVDAAMGFVEKLQEDMERMDERLETMETEKDVLEVRIGRLAQENVELRSKIERLEWDRDRLRERCTSLEQERGELQRTIEELRAKKESDDLGS